MNVADRIATIIKVNQHTASSFADVLGVQRSSISHILNGRNKPSLDLLEKILHHFPRVDARWLITGIAPGPKASAPVKTEAATPKDAKAERPSAAPDVLKGAIGAMEGREEEIERVLIFFRDRTFATYTLRD